MACKRNSKKRFDSEEVYQEPKGNQPTTELTKSKDSNLNDVFRINNPANDTQNVYKNNLKKDVLQEEKVNNTPSSSNSA